MRKSKSAISFSFFFLSRRSLRDFYYPKRKKTREAFFGWSKVKEKKRGGKNTPTKKTLVIIHTHTHTSTIMFAATQQIASVAGLKATKVQVRAPRSFLCVPALAFENAVSLSLLCPRRNAARDIRILDFAYHFFERYGKRSHRARCVSRGVLTDPTSIDRAREERKREHHHRRAQSFFARMNEPLPGAIDHPESTRPDRCERAERFWKKTFSSLESFFDFLLFFSKTSKFLYF